MVGRFDPNGNLYVSDSGSNTIIKVTPGGATSTFASALNAAAHSLGCKLAAPFMSLSFLSLSPIPALKLTDQGLVDAVNMKLTSLFED